MHRCVIAGEILPPARRIGRSKTYQYPVGVDGATVAADWENSLPVGARCMRCGVFLDPRHTPVHVVSERFGYSKVSPTMEVYAHVLPDMHERRPTLGAPLPADGAHGSASWLRHVVLVPRSLLSFEVERLTVGR